MILDSANKLERATQEQCIGLFGAEQMLLWNEFLLIELVRAKDFPACFYSCFAACLFDRFWIKASNSCSKSNKFNFVGPILSQKVLRSQFCPKTNKSFSKLQ